MGPRVALIFKSIIILLIIFLGFIKSRALALLIANNKSVKKRCQLARDLNSDRYDRSQTTDLNNSPTRYHSTTALTAFCCVTIQHVTCHRGVRAVSVACARWAWRACGGRGDIKRENCSVKSFFGKKPKDKRKK